MVIACTPYSKLTLPELRGERLKFESLLARTTVASAREPVQDVLSILGNWIARREREAAEGVAA